jgi:hypothetical protein
MQRSIVIKFALIPALFTLNSCLYINQADLEEYLYDEYPGLKTKVTRFEAHGESYGWREGFRYYRLEVGQEDAMEVLKKYGFVPIEVLSTSKSFRDSKLAIIEPIFCDRDFIQQRSLFYPIWWDMKNQDNACYLVPPVHPHREKRAVYDKKRRILYLHFYFAG